MFTDLITLPAILSAPTQGMTSREIAELTGKRHDHVLRDIDNLVASLSPELGNGFKSDTYTAGEPARSYRQYLLDRDATYCLVAGYDATSRMRIIKRWQELENSPTLTQDAPKMSSRTIAELSGRLHKIVLQQVRTLLAETYHWEATGPFRSVHAALRVSSELQRQYQKVGVEMALDEFGFISEVFLDDRHCRALMANYPARTQGRLLVHLRALEDTYHGSRQLLSQPRHALPHRT